MSARQQAIELLGNVDTRLAHSESVAKQAAVAVCLLDEPWRSVLVDAAWLHDIGYAPTVRRTGFHPLDGPDGSGNKPGHPRCTSWWPGTPTPRPKLA